MKQDHGYIALTSVLVLGALFLSVSIGVVSRAIGSAHASESNILSAQAALSAEACAERALMELIRTYQYAGDETLLISEAYECEIETVEGIGSTDRVVKTKGTEKGFVHRTQITVAETSPVMEIIRWDNVTHF